jgi:leucyl-tRNA synthetase
MKRLNITVMFPYPSGNGLHVGHFYNYAIIDSYCRYKRYLGYEVFQPFGYDSFGLPAENYALKIGGNPRDVTYKNIDNFRKQMRSMNSEYEELLITSDEVYQKETQFIFNILLKKGLAYKKNAEVDFCPNCITTLAKEQVKDNRCERCFTEIENRILNQWYFKITDYKERLINNLDSLDYPKSTIKQQRAWLENLHDWCVSRQRSWGCPIPIKNETDTLDTFVDSSFYYIIYQLIKGLKPKPVDLYVGGSEHACMHLIYARFICMVLFDEKIINFEEPFKKVIHQGMILKDGVKMSKSLGNIITPDDYDSDYMRFYLMFLGHYFDGGSFNDNNFKGIERFVNKLKTWFSKKGVIDLELENFQRIIFNYTEDFKFNKVVSEFMILLNKNKNIGISKKSKDKIVELISIYMPTIKFKLI